MKNRSLCSVILCRAVLSAGLVCVLLSAAGLAQNRSAQAGKRPNIIFIHADDLGYGDLSCYGQQKFTTPHLDRMAAEGARFTQYYSGSTVCAPSRAALMTGLHTGHAYIRGNGEYPLRPADVTVAEVLKSVGYTTAVIGKWGLGTAGTEGRPDKQGFDESFGFLDHTHAHRQYTSHLWKNGEVFPVNLEKDYVGDLFTDAALDFIGKNRQRPFFLYLAYTVPHAELRAPEDAVKQYRGKFPETPWTNAKADAVPTIQPSPMRQPSIGYRSHATPRAAFAAMVTRLDAHVGQVLSKLKELGIDENTIVFFTSDNGPHKEGGADPEFFDSNGPLRGIKRDLYDGGIRVPMIVRFPGKVKAGRTSDQVWSHWDFLPTAAELAGAKTPGKLDGISMVNALTGHRQKQHEFLYWEFYERGFEQAVRMGDWKAVRHGADKPLELYNLKADGGEQNDVAAKHPDVVAKIESYLKTARTESEIWPIKRQEKTATR
jgi:arylsulfatase A